MVRHGSVLLGGALGAAARALLSGVLPAAPLPVGVLVINLVGSLALGYLVAISAESILHPDLRLALGTGFLGAFTTFSTLELGVVLLRAGHGTALAMVYLGLSLVGGVLAAAAGMALARRGAAGPSGRR